jgi:hypothetical protein
VEGGGKLPGDDPLIISDYRVERPAARLLFMLKGILIECAYLRGHIFHIGGGLLIRFNSVRL